MECGSHAAARTHGLRIPHVDVPMLRSFPVCDPVLAGSNGFSDSFLEKEGVNPRSFSPRPHPHLHARRLHAGRVRRAHLHARHVRPHSRRAHRCRHRL